MSYPLTQMGGSAFNHNQSSNAEAEYDRLRGLARQEHDKRARLSEQAHQAYEHGDGGAAHQFSEEAKRHGQTADNYNKQASDYIFRENNAPGRVAADTIDLHGQFANEAEDIVEQRIRYAQSQGQTHLHVIVGKGIHSVNHVQKIKPRVEQVCQELGLNYSTEENAGRMYINLQGGPAHAPPTQHGGGGYGGQPHHGGGQHHGGQQQGGYPGGPQQGHGGQQNQNDNEELEKLAMKFLPKIIRKLEGCCVVM
ncbi:MAG: hypothetical protein M1824_001476 [Vezdaea acicularis]|nr:MAG: hypothetical protein M1824_001476 [Vezdaea acicularis]